MAGVTLDTIGAGALRELFDAELARVLANITDPNTGATAKRVITMTVTFRPKRDRDVADVDLACTAKLAGLASVSTQLFLGKQHGTLIAVERDPRQSNLFDQEPRPLAAVSQFSQDKDGE
jgi:hypothetical protein